MTTAAMLYRLTFIGAAAAAACTPSKTSVKADASAAAAPAHVSLNDMSILIPNNDPAFRSAAILSTDQADQVGQAPADAQGKRDLLPTFILNGLDVQINGEFISNAKANSIIKTVDYPGLLSLLDPTYHAEFPLFSKIINMNQDLSAPLPPNVYTLSAVRFDPCFNIIETKGDDAQCIAQMRLLWQPFTSDGKIIDQNVHEIFLLERAEFIDALATIVRLRQGAESSYDTLELQPQPLMAKQGPTGAYFKGLKALITRYAQQSKLMGAAGLIRTEERVPRNWRMAAITLQNGALPPIAPLSTINKDNSGEAKFAQAFGDTDFTTFGGFPTGINADAFGTPLYKDSEASEAVKKNHASEILAKLDRVNDPHLHDIFDMDCSSCHESTVIAKTLESRCAAPGDPAPLCADHHQINSTVGTEFIGKVPEVLQMFSFRVNLLGATGGKIYPVIQTRVVSETALVVDYVNMHYLNH